MKFLLYCNFKNIEVYQGLYFNLYVYIYIVYTLLVKSLSSPPD